MTKTTKVKVVDIFPQTKEIIATYHIENQKLEHECELLQFQLDEVTELVATNLTKLDSAELNVRFQLNLENKGLNDKAEVIQKMLEETNEAIDILHLKFARMLIDARHAEGRIRQQYNANNIVEKHKRAMLEEINNIAKQMKEQYTEVAPDLRAIFNHETVRYHHPRYSAMINFNDYSPTFSAANNRVISRSEIDNACAGGDL